MNASTFRKYPELGDDYWGEHPEHTLEEWQNEVNNDDTRLGYWEWVLCLVLIGGHYVEED